MLLALKEQYATLVLSSVTLLLLYCSQLLLGAVLLQIMCCEVGKHFQRPGVVDKNLNGI